MFSVSDHAFKCFSYYFKPNSLFCLFAFSSNVSVINKTLLFLCPYFINLLLWHWQLCLDILFTTPVGVLVAKYLNICSHVREQYHAILLKSLYLSLFRWSHANISAVVIVSSLVRIDITHLVGMPQKPNQTFLPF